MTEIVRPFDHIVVVDWSARSTPALGPDTIWTCWLDTRSSDFDLTNHATRRDTRDTLVTRMAATGTERILVAIDVALGYPHGFSLAAGLTGSPSAESAWQATWQHLTDQLDEAADNSAPPQHDRWAVAARLNERLGTPHFWGCPPARASQHLTTTKPPTLADPTVGLAEYRITEERLRAAGHRPFSVWQLLGAGSVGSQALTAIPVLHHLRHHPALAHRVRVWPFETGIDAPPIADIVVAEAWPSSLPRSVVDAVEHPVKDARQVIALAAHLAEAQREGLLHRRFTPNLSDDEARDVVREEGWVLGVA